jgi:hypothetical protein
MKPLCGSCCVPVICSVTFEIENTCKAHGEQRFICFGLLAGSGRYPMQAAWRGASRFQHEESQ